MNFISTELHKGIGAFFNPALTPEWKMAATTMLTKRLDWLAETLGENHCLYTNHFTIADAYLFNVLSWFRVVDFSLDRCHAVGRTDVKKARRCSSTSLIFDIGKYSTVSAISARDARRSSERSWPGDPVEEPVTARSPRIRVNAGTSKGFITAPTY
nr:glutathione S-transferase [Candidatus Pantoea persica]